MATLTIYDGYQLRVTYHSSDNVSKSQQATKQTIPQVITAFKAWFATKSIVLDSYLMYKGKFVVYNAIEIPIEDLVLVDDAVEPWLSLISAEVAASVALQASIEASERAQLAYLKAKYPLTQEEEIALLAELLLKYPQ
jgi:hypothetical protein